MSSIFPFPEGSLTNDSIVTIEQTIDGMNPQVRHAYIVGVGVDKGNGESAPPILDDSALFPGKPLPSFFNFIPTHKAIY